MRTLGLLLVAAALGACVGQLKPAPTAHLVPGRGEGAVAEAGAVKLEARVDAWRGWPPSLEIAVLAVLITLDNGAATPLRVRYEDFELVAADGRRFTARAPFALTGYVAQHVSPYAYPPYGYALPAPLFVPRFRSGFFVGRGFYHDPFFYDYYYPTTTWVRLPSGDMVQMALREGVVEPGGRVTGFVYFERLPRKIDRLDLSVRLVDAGSGETRDTLAIPFVVE